MVSENGKILAVIGERYHYVFDLSTEFKDILLSGYRSKLKPRFYGFQVDEKNSVLGAVSLSYITKDDQISDHLKRNGFKRDANQRGIKRFIYTGKLIGKRYVADKRINDEYLLNKAYSVIVKEPPTASDYIEKVVKTPVTILADGVVVIFGTMALVTVGTICAIKSGCR